MIYFKWTSEMEIGHPEIDRQHRQLFLLAEAVVESMINSDEKSLKVAHLEAFIAFAPEHFKYEEGLMRSAGYPNADQHARDHDSLLTELLSHCRNVLWDQNANATELTNFLWNWLIVHIDIADRELVAWLNSHEPDVTDALVFAPDVEKRG